MTLYQIISGCTKTWGEEGVTVGDNPTYMVISNNNRRHKRNAESAIYDQITPRKESDVERKFDNPIYGQEVADPQEDGVPVVTSPELYEVPVPSAQSAKNVEKEWSELEGGASCYEVPVPSPRPKILVLKESSSLGLGGVANYEVPVSRQHPQSRSPAAQQPKDKPRPLISQHQKNRSPAVQLDKPRPLISQQNQSPAVQPKDRPRPLLAYTNSAPPIRRSEKAQESLVPTTAFTSAGLQRQKVPMLPPKPHQQKQLLEVMSRKLASSPSQQNVYQEPLELATTTTTTTTAAAAAAAAAKTASAEDEDPSSAQSAAAGCRFGPMEYEVPVIKK